MAKGDRPERKELLPGIDPEWVQAAISRPEEEEPDPEFDPDDPDSVWILGNDPEAKISSVADRRNLIHKQMLSTGGQFVMGVLMMFIALGLTIMAITNPVLKFIIPAAIIAPISLWYMRTRWRRWLGSAPYFYRLMSSLGEDAENILVEHEEKKRAKFVNKVGDLYSVNTKPKKKK
ncbi:MAG: hypothetical protein JKX70_04750 [Phycisphaerales bacterium]|nr:hypothetical protein [Phycisphaerales bacterium]